MRLVPLIKPYISGLVDKLIGLDYSLGAASSHLDCVADRPPRYHSLMLSECSIAVINRHCLLAHGIHQFCIAIF